MFSVCCPSCHEGLRPEAPGQDAPNRKVCIEGFPVQPVTRTHYLDRGKLVIRGLLEPLRHARREGKGAACTAARF